MIKIRTLKLILLLTVSTTLAVEFKHKCHHAQKQSKIDIKVMEGPSKRALQSNPITEHNIRIKFDFSLADAFVQSDPTLTELYEMSKRILNNVKTYIEAHFIVNFNERFNDAASECSGVSFPDLVDQEFDLYIMVQPENDPGASYFAAASTCSLSPVDKRPVKGIYYLNFAGMQRSKLKEYFYPSTFVHELTHILGFSESLYVHYKADDRTTDRPISETVQDLNFGGSIHKTIILPAVLEYAKKFYNCPTAVGVPLENEGGAGTASSHWDKLFLPNEYMNPSIENPGIVSDFTIKLLNSTNWYKIDEHAAQPYDWGRGDGCGHFNVCPTGKEYCPSQDQGMNKCTTDYKNKGYCVVLSNFMAGCGIYRSRGSVACMKDVGSEIEGDPEEVFGVHSRCFQWRTASDKVLITQCHLAKCEYGKIEVKFKNGKRIVCREDGEVITLNEEYEFVCPVYTDFCSHWAQRCPLDCSSNGICMKGNRCHCFEGYSGDDCSICDGCTPITDPFILSAKYGGEYVQDGKTASELAKYSSIFGYGVIGLINACLFFWKF